MTKNTNIIHFYNNLHHKFAYFLLIGETCHLEFEVYVNRITAPLLNSGKERLDDILILHLVGGKMYAECNM